MPVENNQRKLPAPKAEPSKHMPNGVPFAGSFEKLFTGRASVLFKILGAATLVPFVVVAGAGKAENFKALDDPRLLTIFLITTSGLGAFLGCCLSIRDAVKQRIRDGKPVNFLLRLFFGYGFVTVLVWLPFVIFGIAVFIQIAE